MAHAGVYKPTRDEFDLLIVPASDVYVVGDPGSLAERMLKVRRTVAGEVAALSASSEHMGDALAQFALTELPHEVLTVVMSHLEWRPAPGTYQRFPGAQQPKMAQQLKMLTFLTSSCGTDVRRCALELLDRVREAWTSRLAALSEMFSGVPDALAGSFALQSARVRAKRFVEHRPEAAPWLDPRLLDTWDSLPAHCRVGALLGHMKRVNDRVSQVLMNGNVCEREFSTWLVSPFVRRVHTELDLGSYTARQAAWGIDRFTTRLVAGNWYDAWYHGPGATNDLLMCMNDFSHDFAGYPAGVFVLSSPPMAALLMDGWASFMEQVAIMHADAGPGACRSSKGPVYRMVRYILQEVCLVHCRSYPVEVAVWRRAVLAGGPAYWPRF